MAALFGVLVAIALIVFAFRSRSWKRLVLGVLGVALFLPSLFFVLALNAWLIDPRFRTYRSFYYDIEEGMSRAEVFGLIDHHYPAGGHRRRPEVMDDSGGGLGFFMNPEHSKEPNCEGIFISLREGRVTGKSYSPD